MPALEAAEYLKEKGHRAFTDEGLYKLMLEAYGDEEAAADAAAKRKQQEMDEMDANKGE